MPAIALFIFGQMLDKLVTANDLGLEGFRMMLPWALAYFGALALESFLSSIRNILEVDAQESVRIRLQTMVIDKVNGFELAKYENPVFYDMLHRASEDMSSRLLVLLRETIEVLSLVISIGGILTILFMGHWSLTVIVAGATLPAVILHKKMHWVIHALHLAQTPQARKAAYLRDLLINREEVSELRLFGLEDHLQTEWRENAIALARERRRITIPRVWLERLVVLTRSWAYTICMAVLGWLATGGSLTIGQYGMLVQAIQRFAGTLDSIVRALGVCYEHCLFLGDIFELLDMEPETSRHTPGSGLTASTDAHGKMGLRLERVTFAYPGSERAVLKDISLQIHEGECIALVGENGAGKSTLAKIMLGLYPPTSGRIYLKNREYNAWSKDALYREFSAVFQEFVKYQFTVKDNIRFGAVSDATEQGIKEAAAISMADEFIEKLTDRYDTLLGPALGGTDLSIGQWQKLATARGFVRKAPFIILDEPTSALDPHAEAEVLGYFFKMVRDRSAIIISHRLASARFSDRILVLKDGELVEVGTHDSLIQRNGEYATLFRMQAQSYT